MILEDLKGKIAVVTGASQGIGKTTSELLLKQKTKVIGIDCNDATIKNANYYHYPCNLQLTEEIEKVFNSINKKTKSIDYLVNVAGIDPKISIEEVDESRWNEIVNINLRGYYFCIRSSLKMLRKGKGKSIVNLSSINYRLGVPGRSVYSTTKAGIIGLTSGLARELGKEGIFSKLNSFLNK